MKNKKMVNAFLIIGLVGFLGYIICDAKIKIEMNKKLDDIHEELKRK